MGCGSQGTVSPLDRAIVLVDEVPGLAQQLLRGWRVLRRPALQFPWKYQRAQAASGGAGPILGWGGGRRQREQGAWRSGPGQGAEAGCGARGKVGLAGVGAGLGLGLEIGVSWAGLWQDLGQGLEARSRLCPLAPLALPSVSLSSATLTLMWDGEGSPPYLL